MYKFSLFKLNYFFFPLSLVLFEFTVYITNDMIQPIMLNIIKDLNANINWLPSSLTIYLAGAFFTQWIFGPISDIWGRRFVMLSGVLFFSSNCLIILFISNIKQFFLVRFFQGMGLCFIGAIGYSSIQEIFKEEYCIKIISLMANISLIAPLFGPLIGSFLINVISWKNIFLIFYFLSILSYIGLYFFMPETIIIREEKLSLTKIFLDFKRIISNFIFMYGSITIGFSNIPLLIWISISPLILVNKFKLSMFLYSLLQLPVFGGLLIGNFLLNLFFCKERILKFIKIGVKPMIFGLFIILLSVFNFYKSYIFLIIGLFFYSFGLGLSNACLTRLTLFSNNISKGTTSSLMNMIVIIIFITGIEISKKIYFLNIENILYFHFLFNGLLWLFFLKKFLKLI